MRYRVDRAACRDYSVSSRLEWILPNGRGGFAMGTVAGSNTRRYHGHLVAATRPPTERMVLLASIEAYVTIAGRSFGLSTNQYVGTVHPTGYSSLEQFTVGEHAEWTFDLDGQIVVKRLKVHRDEEACTIEFQNLGTQHLQLALRPLVCHKFYHDNFRVTDFYPQFLLFPEGRTLLSHQDVKLCIEHPDADRTPTTGWYYRFEHSRESDRGLDPLDDLYCPCELRYTLGPGQSATIVASLGEGVGPMTFGDEKVASDASIPDLLKQSAELHIVRTDDRATIIAGYPWFTDWGRDTMISLPGICLATGKVELARDILASNAKYLHKGLIPNRFPDRDSEPEYNTADATLWFANAIYLTLEAEWHDDFASQAWSWLTEVLEWHIKGTSFGIGVDMSDGLLKQGAPGVQLTWMDAKVGDWVVTPRHGKPVEINGLWINLLRIVEWLGGKLGHETAIVSELAAKAERSFQSKFWKETVGHFLDTIEPDDASLRPNQLIAMSLPFGPAKGQKAKNALQKIRQDLLTANGVRTLGPSEPGYRDRFDGPLAERDLSYHQGTCWPWLTGQYVMALLRTTGNVEEAKLVVSGVRSWLESYGLGGIAEVYDADLPQFPGGCPWQAWSVATILQAWCMVDGAPDN